MNKTQTPLVLPEKLKVGDKIKYVKGDYTYVVKSIKPHSKHKTKIVLVRIDESNGHKRYWRKPKHDFINEINIEDNQGGYWDRPVEQLEEHHYVPAYEQIEIK